MKLDHGTNPCIVDNTLDAEDITFSLIVNIILSSTIMKKLNTSVCATIVFLLLTSLNSFAQRNTFDDVHLFQSFFRDVPIASTLYAEGSYTYSNFDFLDRTTIGAQASYPVTPKIEVGGGAYYVNRMPIEVEGTKALSDVAVYGRYNFVDEETKFSGGIFGTVPIGSKEIGEGNLNFGVFSAIRHPVSGSVVLTGTLGVDFLDTAIEDYEASFNMGGGIIYEINDDFFMVSEFSVRSDLDYSAVSTGIDYKLFEFARFRANLLLGVDQNAPDYGAEGGLLITL